jgi:hypothetical protein
MIAWVVGRIRLFEPPAQFGVEVSPEEVRRLVLSLPRAFEVLVADRVKFRVSHLVFLSFSRDEEFIGFGFPREDRAAVVAAEPHKFRMPRTSDLRYNWLVASLAALDEQEMRELVIDAWRVVVPKRVAAEYVASPEAERARRPGAGSARGDPGPDLMWNGLSSVQTVLR